MQSAHLPVSFISLSIPASGTATQAFSGIGAGSERIYMEAHQSSPNKSKTASGEPGKPGFKSGLAAQSPQPIICLRSGTDHAAVAQLAEHHVANVIVVGSNPISRSCFIRFFPGFRS